MNELCRHAINKFHKSYKCRTFDQDCVALFVILARDYTQKGSIFRELGDFIAHPDEKDRGLVFNSVDAIAEEFDEYIRKGLKLGDRIALKPFYGIGSPEEIFESLKKVFTLANVEVNSLKIASPEFRDFVFCLMFLLSNCKLKFKGVSYPFEVEYEHSVILKVQYRSKEFPNVGSSLGVLRLNNVWINFRGWKGHILKNHIARRMDNGDLAAINYEKDMSLESNLKFTPGVTWPLPPIEGKYA